jgi:hypothetical protein
MAMGSRAALPLIIRIVSSWAFLSQLFFLDEESLQTELRDLLHQVPSFLIIGNPLTDRLFHALRDMDHLSLLSHPQGQIKAGMELTSGALAAGLSAGSLHRDEAAQDKGLFVKDLGEAGASPPFRIGQVASRAHGDSPPFKSILIYLYISDSPRLVKYYRHCEKQILICLDKEKKGRSGAD